MKIGDILAFLRARAQYRGAHARNRLVQYNVAAARQRHFKSDVDRCSRSTDCSFTFSVNGSLP